MLFRILLFFFFSIGICNGQSGEVRFSTIDLRAAKQRAVIEDKLIFVDTYASYCKPCKILSREFRKPKLYQYLNKNFINVKVDMEGKYGQAFKNAYQVVFLPTLMILDKHGNLKFKIDRLATADELLALTKHYQEKLYPESKPYLAEAKPAADRSVARTPAVKKPRPTVKKATIRKKDVVVKAKIEPIKKPVVVPVVNDSEVIVHVLGQDEDLPPEVLKQEAYFRMELMDGSHISVAQDYLKTQEDWSTPENSRFLFDFLYTVNSSEFEYLIEHREAFNTLIGKEQVEESINILVTKELERAFPRPDKAKAIELYGYLDVAEPNKAAAEYNLSTLMDAEDTKNYITEAEAYVDLYDDADVGIIKALSVSILKSSNSKRDLKKAKNYAEQAGKKSPNDSSIILLQSAIYYKMDNIRQAKNYANEALTIAKANGQNILEINKMINTLSTL